jgi:hypothetical protein
MTWAGVALIGITGPGAQPCHPGRPSGSHRCRQRRCWSGSARARQQRDELDAELALLIDCAVSLRIGWPDGASRTDQIA